MMGRPALYSFLLHFVVFLLLFFGIPWFPKEQPESMRVIPVEVMTIAEETMAPKPAVTPVKEEPKPEEKKPEPQPEPEKQTPPPPAPEMEPEPAPVAPPEPPKPEIAKPEPTPEPTPKPEVKEPMPEPQSKPAPPKLKEKEKPKKQEKLKDTKPEKKKKDESFDTILKNLNLEDLKQKVEDDSVASTDPDAPAPARQVGKVGDQLTVSELDLLGSHFKKCWSIPAGAQGAENLVIPIRLSFTSDGMVKDAEIIDKGRFNSDPYYRSAAEAALRAAKDPRCAKLPLSPEKIKKYSSIKLNFDPRLLLGG